MPERKDGTRWGIQSIEIGGRLLRAFILSGEPMPLTALARAAAMTPSKAHRYLASFIRVGLVSQQEKSGRYELGPMVVELGFTALRRLDAFQLGQEAVDTLCGQLDLAVSLTIWTDLGPTIARWAMSPKPIDVYFRLGVVLPLLSSSNGRIFAAYLPRDHTQRLIEAELAERRGRASRAGLHSMRDVEDLLAEVRAQGLGVADGTTDPAVCSVSAPVFDQNNRIVAALTAVGVRGMMDISGRGRPAIAVRSMAGALSRRLGATSIGVASFHDAAPKSPTRKRKP